MKRAAAVVPDEFAGIADEFIRIKRVDGKLSDVIDAARTSVTLDDILDLGKLSPDEIDELAKLGKLSPEKAAKAKKAATINANPGDGIKVEGTKTTGQSLGTIESIDPSEIQSEIS